jgi:hypothetical protein
MTIVGKPHHHSQHKQTETTYRHNDTGREERLFTNIRVDRRVPSRQGRACSQQIIAILVTRGQEIFQQVVHFGMSARKPFSSKNLLVHAGMTAVHVSASTGSTLTASTTDVGIDQRVTERQRCLGCQEVVNVGVAHWHPLSQGGVHQRMARGQVSGPNRSIDRRMTCRDICRTSCGVSIDSGVSAQVGIDGGVSQRQGGCPLAADRQGCDEKLASSPSACRV